MQNTQSELSAISNAEFMKAIFSELKHNEYCWTASFSTSPSLARGEWSGSRTYPEVVADTRYGNSYFCVSALHADEKGASRRTTANFSRLMCVVIDDAGECALAPSWRLETSENKFQLGFILQTPIEDVEIAQRLHSALANQKVINADSSGNNSVRYVRLPVGCNTKYENNFSCKLVEYEPTRKVALIDICDALNIDYASVINGVRIVKDHTQDSTHAGEYVKDAQYITQIVSGASFHEPMNILAARYRSRGADAQFVIEAIKGFMLASQDDSERWRVRFEDVPRSVRTAFEKFEQQEKIEQVKVLLSKERNAYTLDRIEAVEFVIDGFLSNGFTVIAGEPGVGKTSTLVPLFAASAHLCEENSFLKPILRRKVIYIAEDIQQVQRCVYALHKHVAKNIDKKEFYNWFQIVQAVRSDAEAIVKVIKQARDEESYTLENGFTVEPLIVFDTAAATISLENENDNAEVSSVIAKIKEATIGAPVAIIAHTPKAISRSDLAMMTPRGASAWSGDAQATIFLFTDDAFPNARFLALGKRRFECAYSEIRFESDVYEESVTTPWGTQQTVSYRVSRALESSSEQRAELKREGEKQTKALLAASKDSQAINYMRSMSDDYVTSSNLRSIVGGSVVLANKHIESMLERKVIERIILKDHPEIVKTYKNHTSGYILARDYRQLSDGE